MMGRVRSNANTIHLLQRNAQSIRAHGTELRRFLDLQKTDIMLIQKSWLKPQQKFTLKGFQVFRRDRQDERAGRGLLTLVREGIPCNEIAVSGQLEHQKIVLNTSPQITVINLYHAESQLRKEELTAMIGSTTSPLVIGGDFNASNTIWGSKETNSKGKSVEDFIEDNGLVILNSGETTRYGKRQSPSAIDLTVTSACLAADSIWEVGPDLGSDHRPILLRIGGADTEQETTVRPRRWKYEAADWLAFKVSCRIKTEKINSNQDIEALNRELTSCIMEAAEKMIPKKGNPPTGKLVPWWSEACTEVIHERAGAAKIAARTGKLDDYIAYKAAKARAKRTLIEGRRAFWHKKCEELDPRSKIRDLWQLVRAMTGNNARSGTIHLKKADGRMTSSSTEAAEELATFFENVVSNDSLRPGCSQADEELLEEVMQQLESTPEHLSESDVPFSMEEMNAALEHLQKKSSLGHDEISNLMLLNIQKRRR